MTITELYMGINETKDKYSGTDCKFRCTGTYNVYMCVHVHLALRIIISAWSTEALPWQTFDVTE